MTLGVNALDDGLRAGDPSTVVCIIGDKVEVLRAGPVSVDDLLNVVR